MHRLGELARLAHVRRRCLEPDDVRIRRAGEGTGDDGLEAGPDPEEALRCALSGDELLVGWIDVTRQERRAQGIRARDQHGRDAGDVGREPGRGERADELRCRNEHLAAQVTALLLRGQLVLEVDACCARFDHRAHQLVRLERAAETGLGVRDDRRAASRPAGLRPLRPGRRAAARCSAGGRVPARCWPGRGSDRDTSGRRGWHPPRPATQRGRSALRPAFTICTAWSARQGAEGGDVLVRAASPRAAPRRVAPACSTWTGPRSRSTSSVV